MVPLVTGGRNGYEFPNAVRSGPLRVRVVLSRPIGQSVKKQNLRLRSENDNGWALALMARRGVNARTGHCEDAYATMARIRAMHSFLSKASVADR